MKLQLQLTAGGGGQREHRDFHLAVPNVIEVVIPAIVTDDGTRLDEFRLPVISTPRQGVNPTVRLTAELLTWLALVGDMNLDVYMARKASPSRKPVIDHYKDMELPDLPHPLKYRRRGDALSVACDYTDQDGKAKTHQETVTRAQLAPDALEGVLKPVIANVQKFLENTDNHGTHAGPADASLESSL